MELLSLLATLFIGAASGVALYSGMPWLERGFALIEAGFREKLRRMRVSTARLRTYLVLWIAAVFAVFLLLWAGLGIPMLGLLLAVLLVCLPWYVLRRLASKRAEKIEDQLSDAMVSLSSAVRSGLSLAQSMEILSQQCPHPINQEFRQIYGEYQLGKPLEQCLLETKARLKSENFALFAAALEASRRSGGRLNETVERIAHSVRELQRLERKVQSETAQARASAFYMALAPPAILLLYYLFVDPVNTERLFTTVLGQIILGIAVVMNIIAYFWARKILSPDI